MGAAVALVAFFALVVLGVSSDAVLSILSPKTVQFVVIGAALVFAIAVGCFVWLTMREPDPAQVTLWSWQASLGLLGGAVATPLLPTPQRIYVETSAGDMQTIFDTSEVINSDNIYLLIILFVSSIVFHISVKYLQKNGHI